MPRRIIYIQNPTTGSHFRTLGGSGGGSHTTPRPGGSGGGNNTTPQPGYSNIGFNAQYTQGLPNWNNWWTSFPNTSQLPNEIYTQPGNMPAGTPGTVDIFNGLTPEQFYQEQWDEQNGIGFWIWYFQTLSEGIDPNTGAIQAPLGTEGQNSMSPWGGLGYTDLGPQYYHFGPQYGAQIPTQYWGPANFGSAYQAYLQSIGAAQPSLSTPAADPAKGTYLPAQPWQPNSYPSFQQIIGD